MIARAPKIDPLAELRRRAASGDAAAARQLASLENAPVVPETDDERAAMAEAVARHDGTWRTSDEVREIIEERRRTEGG